MHFTSLASLETRFVIRHCVISLQFRKVKILRFVSGLNFWGYFNRSFLSLAINSRFYVKITSSFSLYMEASRKTTAAL